MINSLFNSVESLQIQAKTDLTNNILNDASHYLKGSQLMELNKTLINHFNDYEIFIMEDKNLHKDYHEENETIINVYLKNKTLEGLSPRTLSYYEDTIRKMMNYVNKHLSDVTTGDIREFLNYTQELNNCSNSTLDNLRRNLNTFFKTISDEGYIQTNPMAKIKKIKSTKKVKKPFTDFEIEKMRNKLSEKQCRTKLHQYNKIQKQALFELLLSSGIRIGECVRLNREDIDLNDRSFIVLGKGNKERQCYFSAKAQFYLDQLINFKCTGRTRKFKDKKPLFMNIRNAERLEQYGIERNIRELGKSVGVKAHPHKFRRTFATNLVNKGVPIEQIKELLGHANIDTTLLYAIVDKDQVRYNHDKYAG